METNSSFAYTTRCDLACIPFFYLLLVLELRQQEMRLFKCEQVVDRDLYRDPSHPGMGLGFFQNISGAHSPLVSQEFAPAQTRGL